MIVSLPTPDGPEMMTSIGFAGSGGSPPIPLPGGSDSLGRRRLGSCRPLLDGAPTRPSRRSGARRPARAARGCCRSRSSTDSSSGGSGAVARMTWPSLGDCSSIRQLCRNSRSSPSGPSSRRAGAVQRVARQRMADRRQVDPDLVRSAGDQVQLEQRPAGQPLADPIAGHGLAAVGTTAIRVRWCGSRPIGASIAPGRRRDGALDQAEVGLLDAASLELGHQAGLGPIVLGDHQQAARVAVEAMDDARPLDAGDAAVLGVAGERAR